MDHTAVDNVQKASFIRSFIIATDATVDVMISLSMQMSTVLHLENNWNCWSIDGMCREK